MRSQNKINANYTWADAPLEDPIGLMAGELLRSHPQYAEVCTLFNINNLPMLTYGAEIERTLGQIFDARLSFHVPERMATEVKDFAGERAPTQKNLEGYMNSYGPNLSKFFIAVSTVPPLPDVVQKGTVLHEYGHYIEQRKAVTLGSTRAHEIRDTSFKSAYCLFKKNFPKLSEKKALEAADELVAWLNGLWLCWLLELDTGLIVAGMVLDEVSQPDSETGFPQHCLPKIREYFLDRQIAERHFNSANGQSFTECLYLEHEEQLCFMIEDATRRLLNIVKASASSSIVSDGLDVTHEASQGISLGARGEAQAATLDQIALDTSLQ